MVTQMEILIYVRTKGKASTKEIMEHFVQDYPLKGVEIDCALSWGTNGHKDRARRNIYNLLWKMQQKNQLKVLDKTHYQGNIWTVA